MIHNSPENAKSTVSGQPPRSRAHARARAAYAASLAACGAWLEACKTYGYKSPQERAASAAMDKAIEIHDKASRAACREFYQGEPAPDLDPAAGSGALGAPGKRRRRVTRGLMATGKRARLPDGTMVPIFERVR